MAVAWAGRPSVAFIGDVHGWIDRLETVLAQVRGRPLILMGDLLDRGPESRTVVRRVRTLVESGLAHSLMGNHEYALVRGLGCPSLGLPPDPRLFATWCAAYGGHATCTSYGVPPGDAAALRQAMGTDVDFLARLPWVIRSTTAGCAFVAVHAGLSSQPWLPQIKEAQSIGILWPKHSPQPEILYAKDRLGVIPQDFPAGCCLVTGHVPLPRPEITSRMVACDTSGGLPNRRLSAVIWPEGRVVTG